MLQFPAFFPSVWIIFVPIIIVMFKTFKQFPPDVVYNYVFNEKEEVGELSHLLQH